MGGELKMRKFAFALTVLASLYLGFCTVSYGQGGVGELTGVIYDPTGSVVEGATVKLQNASTGFEREMDSTSAGIYRFSALSVVGKYTLTVEHAGFRAAKVDGVVISVGSTVTVDVRLEVGVISESVTVEAGSELVNPSESQISQLIDRTVWQNLPLEIRNQNTFINLVAGVSPVITGPSGTDLNGTTRGAAVNGARPGSGNFLLDGFDNNDIGQGGRGSEGQGAVTSISPEAIQEFRVITHNFAAEYGKGGGFVTDTVLKSGTNSLHGSLFEYNRVQALAAEDFFTNASGGKDSLVRNQFGGSLGGHIIKDKWFYFGSYEAHRRVQTAPLPSTSVLTPEFLNFVKSGAFEQFQEGTGPYTTVTKTTHNDGTATSPPTVGFSGSGICRALSSTVANPNGNPCPGLFSQSSTLGPIFAKLSTTQPFPTVAGGTCATGTAIGTSADPCAAQGVFTSVLPYTNITVPTSATLQYPVAEFGTVALSDPNTFFQHRVSFKSDYKISNNDSLVGTFNYTTQKSVDKFGGGDGTIGPAFENPDVQLLLGFAWTHNFSATVLNQLRASYLRHRSDFPNPAGTAGIPDILSANDSLGVSFGNTSALPQFFTDGMFQYKDDLSIVKGKHTFKLGGEYRRIRNASSFQAEKNGIFFFQSTEELLTDGFFGDVADTFLNGAPTSGSIFEAGTSLNPQTGGFPIYYRGYRANEVALYGQDDWKVLPRLTLNLGLRWEYFGPPHNYKPGLDSNIFWGSPLTPFPTNGNGNPFLPVNSQQAAQEAGARAVQVNNNIWAKDTNNFAPRIGFAWDVFGTQKFVLRGGGGFFYDRIYDNVFENIRFNPPLFNFATLGIGFAPAAGAIGPIDSPGLYTVPFTNPSPFAPFAPLPGGRHIDQNLRAPYTQQANLGVQYAVAKDFVLEVNGAYTGGRALLGIVDINTYNGRRACDGATASGATQAAKCAAAFAAGQIPAATFTARRLNPTLASDGFRGNSYGSSYYGLQVSMTKRLSRGLQFNSNYTWSHALDTLSDAFNGGHALVAGQTDVYNTAADKGNADFDIRHRFVTNAYYELPIFKNNRWLGGWSMDGIVTIQKGVPIPILNGTQSRDTNRDGHTTDRPAIIGNPYVGGKSPADGFLNPASFAAYTCPATVNFGLFCDSATGRNTLIGPGFVNTDFGIAKKFRIREAMTLQFQGNFFNIFNHPNFGTPVGNRFGNPSQFGQSVSDFGPRITQLALRLDF
jgi:Carboxypeptidase regulatory-like domain/TonB dependent receptor